MARSPVRAVTHRCGRVVVVGLLLISWTPGARGQAGPASQPINARENLERAFAVLDKAAAAIPADTFDPLAVVTKIGAHPDELFAWVRDNTRWLPYRGALRGPVGVLMDRGGNSLDRSLLLAEFYSHTGTTVRLAHANLSPDQAKALYEKLRVAPRPKPIAFDIGDGAGEAGEAAAGQLERLGEDLTQRATALSTSLAAATSSLAAPTAVDVKTDALTALADHWWLQRQDPAGWTDLDVTLPGAKPGDVVCPAERTDPISAGDAMSLNGLWHTVRIAVIAEQCVDGKLSTTKVLSRTIKPGRSVGSTIYLTNSPLDWNERPPSRTTDDAAAAASALQLALKPTEWVPTLKLGIETASDAGIRPDGSVDPKPQQDATARLGGGTSKAMSGALDALSAAPPASAPTAPAGLFSAEWVEYTIEVPGSADQVIRRDVFDLIGPAARAAGITAQPQPTDLARANAALALDGRIDLVALPCQPSPAFVEHLLTDFLSRSKAALLKSLDAMDAAHGGTEADVPPPCSAPLYGLAVARRLFSPCPADWFIGRPNLFAYHSFAQLTGDTHERFVEATDLIADDAAIDPWSAADPSKVRIAQGVLDTAAEASFVPGTAARYSAADALAAAAARNVPFTVIKTRTDLAKLSLPADVAARVTAELDNGRTVAIPTAAVPIGGKDRFAWWSIDPVTGQPLGIGDNGWGDAMAEYSAMITRFIMTHREWVCVGAATASIANVMSSILPLGELGGDALQVITTALDVACAGP